MRWHAENMSAKAVSNLVAQTISFTGNDLPSTGVVAFHFCTTGAANTLANILANGFRVKADGQTIYDTDVTALRKWMERFTQGNYAPATTATRWSLWFNFSDIVDDDLADTCQFPPGTIPTVEFLTNASAVTGSVFGGWTQCDVEQHFTPYLLQQANNIGATQKQAQFPINTPGNAAIRGLILPTTGLGTLRLELNSYPYINNTSALYQNVATGDMLQELDAIEDGSTSGAPTITTHAAIRVPMIVPSQGLSRLVLDTESTWTAANAITLWMAHAL
jgi:hypothetical protein